MLPASAALLAAGGEPQPSRAERRAKPVKPPLLVQVGTGGGKTSRLIPRLVQDGPIGVQTKTTDLARALGELLAKARHHTLVWRGRHQSVAPETGSSPGACQFFDRVAEPVGEAGFAPANVACLRCPAGHLAQATAHWGRGEAEKAQDSERKAEELCANYGLDPETVTPCGHILQANAARSAWALVWAEGAFSPSFLDFQPAPGMPTQKRRLIVDEIAALLLDLALDPKELRKLGKAARQLADSLPKERRPGDPISPEALRVVADLFLRMAGLVASSEKGAAVSQEMLDVIGRIAALTEPIMSQGSLPAATFERPQLDWQTWEHFIPRRAVETLKWAAEFGALWLADGELHAQAPTPLLKAVIEGGVEVILLDATPNPTTLAVVRSLGGKVVVHEPEQPLSVEWDVARSYSRTSVRRRGIPKVAKGISDTYRRMAAEHGKAPKIITYRFLEPELQKQGVAAADIGHWFDAEFGQNAFSGHDLLVVGFPLPPPHALAGMWRAHEAILSWLDPGYQRRGWTEETVSGVEVEVAPGQKATNHVPLSADPVIRDWELCLAGSHVVQALGRVRALHHPGHKAVLAMPPFPIGGLGYDEHVQIISDRDPLRLGPTRPVWRESKRADTDTRGVEAAISLLKQGKSVSRRAINDVLHAHRQPGIGSDSYKRWHGRYEGMSLEDFRAVLIELHRQLAELAKRGAPVLPHMLAPGEPECRCAGCAAAELVQLAVASGPTGPRSPPQAA